MSGDDIKHYQKTMYILGIIFTLLFIVIGLDYLGYVRVKIPQTDDASELPDKLPIKIPFGEGIIGSAGVYGLIFLYHKYEGLNDHVSRINTDISEIKNDIRDIRSEIRDVGKDIRGIREESLKKEGK